MAIEPDGKDWTWVLERRCPDCGFDPATVTRAGVADRIRRSADDWTTVLATPGAAARPNDHTWSPLEYGCHVRDVHDLMRERLTLMLAAQPAHFANWDQDATAIAADYAGQDPGTVAAALAEAAAAFADAYSAVADDEWGREGLRSNGSRFTVESFAAYALHDLEHHRVDVGLPAREDWAGPAGLRAIAAEHRTRIAGWRDPAAFAVGYRDAAGWHFPVVNGPTAAGSLTAILLAEVLDHRAGSATHRLDEPTLAAAIASLARAEATTELRHPNLAAWRAVAAADAPERAAVFVDDLAGPETSEAHRAVLAALRADA